MFGILITSAVYTWHFVYLTVLFFFLNAIFFYGGYNWLDGPQPFTGGEWKRGGTEDGGEEEEEKSRRLSDRQRRRRTDNLNSPVCVRREACDEDIHPSLLWMVEVAGWSFWRGRWRVCFLFSDVDSDDPGGPAPPTLPADGG